MAKETNKKEKLTKDEMAKRLKEEIVVLKLELEHSKLIADIQEQSTRRSSLLVQEANIIHSNKSAETKPEVEAEKISE